MNEPVHLTRCDPLCNMARFYRLEIAPDLFGGAVLLRQWGRIGTEGQGRRDWYSEAGAARAACDGWIRRKCARGYQTGGV
ncbi:WGR domain-containing protein [uncultured Paracoccus sp.]|uniref:WGR domain-containing protein n=1 Tax=uncultured Paracoccus sp. TaxID=189685 RepID=UPI00260CB120|nr:WGR domain-containing protein [uncultured Paracoccus sp.]